MWSLGRNILFSAPTSAGKTLVAELLLHQRLAHPVSATQPPLQVGPVDATALPPRQLAMVVLPYVSLVVEKTATLKRLFSARVKDPLALRYPHRRYKGLRTVAHYANAPGSASLHGYKKGDILVCTIEKVSHAPPPWLYP